jgi:DNA processing protein
LLVLGLHIRIETGRDEGAHGEGLADIGSAAVFGVDAESTLHTRTGNQFDDTSGRLTGPPNDAEAGRQRIIVLLGPSLISLDELGRAAEAPARAVRVALLELELAGRIEYSGDRVAVRASVDER